MVLIAALYISSFHETFSGFLTTKRFACQIVLNIGFIPELREPLRVLHVPQFTYKGIFDIMMM